MLACKLGPGFITEAIGMVLIRRGGFPLRNEMKRGLGYFQRHQLNIPFLLLLQIDIIPKEYIEELQKTERGMTSKKVSSRRVKEIHNK